MMCFSDQAERSEMQNLTKKFDQTEGKSQTNPKIT